MDTNRMSTTDVVRWIALPLGPLLGLVVYLLLEGTGLEHAPRAVAGSAVWMAAWWMTETVPLAATSLLPVVLFPALQITDLAGASGPYAHPLVGLFFGGFVLGMGIEKWGLHRRLALATVLGVGTRPSRLIAGFMVATALLSMFISNTATALMMMPIAVSVIALLARMGMGRANFGPSLLLAIAFASSIGGVVTVTGTQPNIITVALLRDRGIEIRWAQWLPLGLTLCVIMMPIAWFLLTRVTLPVHVKEISGVKSMLRIEYSGLGRISRGEWTVMTVFGLVAAGWILRGWTQETLAAWGLTHLSESLAALGDAGIAMLGAVAMFAVPVNAKKRVFAMDWQSAAKLPWDVLLLFGGGLSLAAAMKSSGLDVYIGAQMSGLSGLPTWAIILIITLAVVFLTNLTSNTATTAALVPVLGSAALGMGIHPVLLMVPAGIIASYAFILPVATPPNAIVFSSGGVKITQMAWSGLLLSIIAAVVVTAVISITGGRLLGIDTSVLPGAPAERAAETRAVTPGSGA